MAKGGKQPGAGRPKGSTPRPQRRDYYSEKERKALAADLKKRAKKDDSLFKFELEQVFGKAAQSIDLTSDGDKFEGIGTIIIQSPDEKNTRNKSKS